MRVSDMKKETVRLWSDPAAESELVVYRDVQDEAVPVPKPAMIVIPGGGYRTVCEETEGEPIALRFREYGFRVFVLHYRVSPHRFPAPLDDAVRAVRMVRGRAVEWGVIPGNVAVCGFSAGGHLAAAAGTIYRHSKAVNGDAFDAEDPRPDASVLCYPVITGGEFRHEGSLMCMMGPQAGAAECELFSLEKHVGEDTPPAYVWAVSGDKTVPVENSIMFVNAMRAADRACSLHIFPGGWHGMQLGSGRADISLWPDEAVLFLREICGFMFGD